ncbi:MAG: hypothetical protein ACK5XN_10605, partial [Bacteroidota bacterium]
LNIDVKNLSCIKILSKILRNHSSTHKFSDMVYEMFNKNINFNFFYLNSLTDVQVDNISKYVNYLDKVHNLLESKAKNENIYDFSQKIFSLVHKTTQIYELDWNIKDIVDHH